VRLAAAASLGLLIAAGETIGWTDFSPLSGQLTPPVVGRLPSERFVRTLGVETMLEITHAFSRRLQLSVAGGAFRGWQGQARLALRWGDRGLL
jgi:hypothetical protein